MRLGAPRAGLCLLALVLGSAAARFAASLTFQAPWIAPDEMVYGLLGESLWSRGDLTVRGEHIGYYSLVYPAFVGGPLSLLDLTSGIVVLKALQALAMSAVAVPVYFWGRRLMSTPMALVAAGLCLLPPAMAYSGLIMSESIYYPLVAAALAALGFAVERPTIFRLALLTGTVTLAAAVRLQALVLVPTFVFALVLDACMARDARRIRLFSAITVGAAVLSGAVVLATYGDSSWSEALGAYGTVGTSRPAPEAVAGGFVESVAGVSLMSLLIPFLATAVLAVTALVRGEPDGPRRAYLATSVSYLVCLCLEVAFVAASFVAYLPERYLITMLPLLFLGFCLWLATGAQRSSGILAGIVCASIAAVAAIAPDHLFATIGTHDLLTTLPLRDLAEGAGGAMTRAGVVGVAVVAAAAFALVPARRAGVLVVALAAGLALISIGASREVARQSRLEEAKAFGNAEPDWIDAGSRGATVALLDTGDREWPIIPRTVFWNRSVTTVARLPGAHDTGALPQVRVDPGPDGVLRTEGGDALEESLVVAPAEVILSGTPIATGVPTSVASNLVLWRVAAPARVESVVSGVAANGDFEAPVYVTVYACGPGRLELTLIGKSGGPVAVRANGIPQLTVAPPPGSVWHGVVPAPPTRDGASVCVFELEPAGLVGSTRIAFERET